MFSVGLREDVTNVVLMSEFLWSIIVNAREISHGNYFSNIYDNRWLILILTQYLSILLKVNKRQINDIFQNLNFL